MNYRQKKKRNKGKITLIIGAAGMLRERDCERIRRNVEHQLKNGNVVLLPTYLHVEAIITQGEKARVRVEQEKIKYITGTGVRI